VQESWTLTSPTVTMTDGVDMPKANVGKVYTNGTNGEPVAVQLFYDGEVVSIPWSQIKLIRSA